MVQEVINKPLKKELIAVHLVFALRDTGFDIVKTIAPNEDAAYQDIKLIYIQGYLSKLEYANEKLRKKIRHLTAKSYVEKNLFKIYRPNKKTYK